MPYGNCYLTILITYKSFYMTLIISHKSNIKFQYKCGTLNILIVCKRRKTENAWVVSTINYVASYSYYDHIIQLIIATCMYVATRNILMCFIFWAMAFCLKN